VAWKKTNLTHDKSTHSPIKRNALQHRISTKELKPGLVAFYDIRPGKTAGLFLYENISKRGDKRGKVKKKMISREAYDMNDINKQTIYIAPKSKLKSNKIPRITRKMALRQCACTDIVEEKEEFICHVTKQQQ